MTTPAPMPDPHPTKDAQPMPDPHLTEDARRTEATRRVKAVRG